MSLLRRGRESNPCIEVLQTPALPLRHRAIMSNFKQSLSPRYSPTGIDGLYVSLIRINSQTTQSTLRPYASLSEALRAGHCAT